MKGHQILILCTLFITLSQFGCLPRNAQITNVDSPNPCPPDRFLKQFSKAVAELDIDKITNLFLPPNDTEAGINRRMHIQEVQKDWPPLKEQGKKITVSFQQTHFYESNGLIRTNMVVKSSGEKTETIPIEFKIIPTNDGCRIVSMKYL